MLEAIAPISPRALRNLVDYDPETGRLFWKERSPYMFEDGGHSAEHSCAAWNARYCGNEAFKKKSRNRYLIGSIAGRTYLAHRVAWAVYYGKWPAHEIDHINGDRADNRIANLRDVTKSVNGRNLKKNRRNASGVTGVFWHEKAGKWSASIGFNGSVKYLGVFESIEAAAATRLAAERECGFHPDHGRR